MTSKQKSDKAKPPVLTTGLVSKKERVHINFMVDKEDDDFIDSFCLQQGHKSQMYRRIVSDWCKKHRDKEGK